MFVLNLIDKNNTIYNYIADYSEPLVDPETIAGIGLTTYTLTGPDTIYEDGTNNTYTITTTNFIGTLYWSINGTTNDFTAINGSSEVELYNNGSKRGVFDLTAIRDSTTDGDQSYTLYIRTGSTSGPVVGNLPITVIDSSQDGDVPSGGSPFNINFINGDHMHLITDGSRIGQV